MEYKLCIEGINGKIDITDTQIIQKIDIRIYQSDKSSNDRSDQLFSELTIYGLLNDKSKKETQEIFEWSKKIDKANVYRIISLQVYNQKDLVRDYYLKEMYCDSYEEIFDECSSQDGPKADSIGSFVLKMKQRKGAIDTIVVESE